MDEARRVGRSGKNSESMEATKRIDRIGITGGDSKEICIRKQRIIEEIMIIEFHLKS